MPRYYRNFFIVLLALTFSNSITIAARRIPIKTKNSVTATSSTPIETKDQPIIIFDLVNVLFKENYAGFAQKIGYGLLASYAVTHWRNPGHRCLDMLHTISDSAEQKPHLRITLNNRTMPRCIVELYEGKKTCAEIKDEIRNAIEELDNNKFFVSSKEKSIMRSIIDLTFDPTVTASITEPIKQMISLAQKLKQNGYSVYLLTNIPDEFYTVLQNNHPSVITLFDGIVVSSHIKTAKPNKEAFEHLLTAHNLNPTSCILVDNNPENVSTAKSLGMKAIVHEKASNTIQYLKKCGVRV